MKKLFIIAIFTLLSANASAGYTVSGNVLTSTDSWWQVELAYPLSGIPCNSGSDTVCTLDEGQYKYNGASGVEMFSITATTSSPIFTIVTEICKDVADCTATCSANSQAIGGSCWAENQDIFAATNGLTFSNGHMCEIFNFELIQPQIVAQVSCAR